VEGVKEGAETDMAAVRVGPSLGRTAGGLGPRIEKHHPCAVYDVCLHPAYVQHLLYLPCSDYIMV
jgi:hypothetical protein